MPAQYFCDKCGKSEAIEDHDGLILCEYHWAIHDLFSAETEYHYLLEWLKKTHIKELKEKRIEIARLKNLISELEKTSNVK